MEYPIADYQDAVRVGRSFSAVRAYDPDQVDGGCIQAPYCSVRKEWGWDHHDDFCPMFSDYSSAPNETE